MKSKSTENSRYEPSKIEPKWQKIWDETGIYNAVDNDPSRAKAYYMFEFPYPSGDGLHVGHLRPYTGLDVMVRHKRMQGFNVLFPMGWDAFGLPTENYAIKNKIAPQLATERNVANFKRQVKAMGYSIDWTREINTTDPKYYKWTQWLFLQFLKAGLAYQDEIAINWCPQCKTGLSNEEVVNGRHERCGTVVEKKLLKQWLLKITAYADRLIDDLKLVDYPERVSSQQINWIGRSQGAEIEFGIKNQESRIKVFTTRPDTLAGATFLVLAPEHPLVHKITADSQKSKVESYIKKVQSETDLNRQDQERPKTGVWTGAVSQNPITGADMPIWIADYVLMGYGTGAIMAVPAHDERDFEFAQKFELPVRFVIRPPKLSTALILHGTDGNNQKAWIPWLKSELENHGFDVITPNLPDADFPDEEKWQRALAEVADKLDDNSVVIGHSSGAPTAVQFLLKNNKHVKKLLLVAPTFPDMDWKKYKQIHSDASSNNIQVVSQNPPDWAKLQDAADEVIVFYSTNDEYIPVEEIEHTLKAKIPWAKFIKFADKHHFNDGAGIKSLPEAVSYLVDPFVGKGVLVNSGQFDGLISEEAQQAIVKWLEEQGLGRSATKYKLRDWVFSRQRYWGEPIPVIHCEKCRAHAIGGALELTFRDPGEWSRLMTGRKTIETRALNPSEPERFFGDVKEGSILKAVFRPTNEMAYLRVEASAVYKDLDKLWADQPKHSQIWPDSAPKSRAELDERYEFGPDYLDRVKKNGLVAWQIERITPGVIPVPEDQLPVVLPVVESYEPTDTGESPLANVAEWVNVSCPQCGGPAKRETDTMPNWAGSSWYFLRYLDPANDAVFADPDRLKYWLPVDLYNGGMEHTTLHLLYSRFWHKFLYDQKLVPNPEPYARRRSNDVILGPDGQKMSKSKGNVISPDPIVKQYGADTLRLYELFIGPFENTAAWSDEQLAGVQRFVQRIWKLVSELARSEEVRQSEVNSENNVGAFELEVDRQTHKTLKKVHHDIESMSFNTAVSSLMEYLNFVSKPEHTQKLRQVNAQNLRSRTLRSFILMLAPLAPHMAEELWHEALGEVESVHMSPWPAYDPELIKDDLVEIIIQVNGKLRGTMVVPVEAGDDELKAAAAEVESVKKYLDGDIAKTIVVPRKLVNFVVSSTEQYEVGLKIT